MDDFSTPTPLPWAIWRIEIRRRRHRGRPGLAVDFGLSFAERVDLQKRLNALGFKTG